MARNSYKKSTVNGITYYYKQIEIGWSSDGKRKRKVLRGKTVSELEEKIREFNKLQELGGIGESSNITFVTFFNDWLYNINLPDKKPSTQERYEGLYLNYIKNSSISNLKLSKINAIKIQEFYNSLITEKSVTASTIHSIHKLIKPCLNYAYRNGNTVRDFGASGLIKLPKKESNKEEVTVLSIEEQHLFIKSLINNKDRIIYLTALGTGLRLGELLGLKWSDIHFIDGTISVQRSIKRVKDIKTKKSSIIEQDPKTYKSKRTIPLPDVLLNELKKHKKEQSELKLLLGSDYKDKNLIFSTEFGNYFEPNNINKRFKKALKKAGINPIKFHSLRHTYATRLFEKDVPLKTVSELLGHTDINITANTYTHVLENKKIEAVQQLNNILIL